MCLLFLSGTFFSRLLKRCKFNWAERTGRPEGDNYKFVPPGNFGALTSTEKYKKLEMNNKIFAPPSLLHQCLVWEAKDAGNCVCCYGTLNLKQRDEIQPKQCEEQWHPRSFHPTWQRRLHGFVIIQKYGMDFFFCPSNPYKNNKRLPSVSDLQDLFEIVFCFLFFFFFYVKTLNLTWILRTKWNQRWLLKRLIIPQLHLFENLLREHPLPSGPELVLWMFSCAAISKQYSLVGFNKQDYVNPAI